MVHRDHGYLGNRRIGPLSCAGGVTVTLWKAHMPPPYQSFEQICEGLAARPDVWGRIREEQLYIPLLPFLEHPYSIVAARLIDGLAAAGVPRAEAQRVSLRGLVVFALSGPMRWGWGGYAVSWIEAGFPIDNEIASALEAIAQDKRFPQRVRHRAFAAARRWRRAKADPADADVLHSPLPTRRNGRLVLLPGLDGTGRLLRNFRDAIGSHTTTILVSYPADRMLDYAALEAFVRSRLPKRKPFVLLAELFSGPIAIGIAARRSCRVARPHSGLLLCAQSDSSAGSAGPADPDPAHPLGTGRAARLANSWPLYNACPAI